MIQAAPAQSEYVRRWQADFGFVANAQPRPDGYIREGRIYVALRCHCIAADCPGWAMVHDTPDDRAHFERLFGGRR